MQDRYLAEDDKRRAAHLRLADYFAVQDLEMGAGPNLRKIDELPRQLARAEAWERLHGLLLEPAFFLEAWNQDQYEVRAAWAQIEAHSPLRLTTAYQPLLADPAGQEADYVYEVASLLADTGHPEEALVLQTHLVAHYRRTGDRYRLSASPGQPGEYPLCPGRPGRRHGPL